MIPQHDFAETCVVSLVLLFQTPSPQRDVSRQRDALEQSPIQS